MIFVSLDTSSAKWILYTYCYKVMELMIVFTCYGNEQTLFASHDAD